jgi:hypothetical protein
MTISGGCQCGAVRFRVDGKLGRASLCHCRMCQKAFGGFYGPLVTAKRGEVVWTRGEPARFQSSNKVQRGFCSACGTPLTFEWSPDEIDLAIGAFDDPAPLKPAVQMATEFAVPWVHDLADVPRVEVGQSQSLSAHHGSIVSYQHPDHDTETWPPAH